MSLLRKTRLFLYYLTSITLLLGIGLFWYYGGKWSDTLLIPPTHDKPEQQVEQNPADYGLEITPLSVIREDGTPIRARFVKAYQGERIGLAVRSQQMKKLLTEQKPLPPLPRPDAIARGTILLIHDWGDSLEHLYPLTEYLTAAEFNCILYDLAAHGESTEKLFPWGNQLTLDAQNVLNAAQSQQGDLGVIGTIGIGTGAGIALQIATQLPQIRSVVAINAYTTLKDIYWNKLLSHYHYSKTSSYIPYILGDQFLTRRIGMRCFDIAPVAYASRIKIPSLLIANDIANAETSYDAQKIYTAIDGKEKQLLTYFSTKDSQPFPEEELDLYTHIITWLSIHNQPQTPTIFTPVRRVPLSK